MPPRSGTPESEKRPPPLPRSRAAPAKATRPSPVPRREPEADASALAALDVLEAAAEDALDLVLEPQRRAPDDGLVGRLEPRRARPRRRPAASMRAWAIVFCERPPVGGEHRPDHRAGHRHRRACPARRATIDDARRRSPPPPTRTSPEIGMLAADDQRDDPGRRWRGRPCPAQRVVTLLGASLNQPRVDDVAARAPCRSRRRDVPNLGRSSGVM